MPENKLEIIPVIDLKNSAVVRANRGNRHLYAPIETKLAATSEPADVVRGLLSLHPFKKMYIADLDAIEGRSDHSSCITSLETQFPQVRFWLDAGIDSEERARTWLAAHRGDLVLGSESLSDARLVGQLRACERVLLSLDFRGEAQQGPACLFNDEALWPRRSSHARKAGMRFTQRAAFAISPILRHCAESAPPECWSLRRCMTASCAPLISEQDHRA
jgi:phosphoribosylformimino-5-aminoimidazole carboxamide ribotide isomerase